MAPLRRSSTPAALCGIQDVNRHTDRDTGEAPLAGSGTGQERARALHHTSPPTVESDGIDGILVEPSIGSMATWVSRASV